MFDRILRSLKATLRDQDALKVAFRDQQLTSRRPAAAEAGDVHP
jgi:hypothetical protein